MVAGWHYIDETWYYFDGSGAWSNYNFLGITREQIVAELEAHRYDNYYLGTKYRGLSLSSGLTDPCMHPNGSPRWDGYVGLNCTGFVAFLIPDWSKPGADCHIGIYLGDYPGHNQFWHQVDTNKISHIYAGTPVIRYYIIKTGM